MEHVTTSQSEQFFFNRRFLALLTIMRYSNITILCTDIRSGRRQCASGAMPNKTNELRKHEGKDPPLVRQVFHLFNMMCSIRTGRISSSILTKTTMQICEAPEIFISCECYETPCLVPEQQTFEALIPIRLRKANSCYIM